ncbi:MAG TPA: hypothetical protein VH115_02810 [Solirubrobacteraceae bacterium]|nr:hypothetical protein [Solirubrobacteraceae bacterium]
MQLAGATEENVALVGEVPEERSLCEPGALGDLGDGRLLEAVLGVQLDRGLREPAARVGLPPGHDVIIVMTATDILC